MTNSLRTSHSMIDQPQFEPSRYAALSGGSRAAVSSGSAWHLADRPPDCRTSGSERASTLVGMAFPPRAGLSLLLNPSDGTMVPEGVRGLGGALDAERGSDGIVSRASMHAGDRKGLGNAQCLPPQRQGGSLSGAVPCALGAAESAHVGHAPPPDDRAAADVAIADPFIKQAWIEQWQRHLDYYRAVVSEPLLPEGVTLSPRDQLALAQIKQEIAEMEAMLPLLDGRAPPLGSDFSIQQFRLLAKYAVKDARIRKEVKELILRMPELVTTQLTVVSQLVFAANGMREAIWDDSRRFGRRVPEVTDYLRQIDLSIKSALHETTTQCKVQVGILELVRAASQGFADAGLEGLNVSMGGKIAHWMHLRRGSPSWQAGRMRHELLESFGNWFHVQSVGEGQISISLKPDVVGRESCAELVQTLEQMSLMLQNGRDRAAVRAAILASQDVHWVQHGGCERLELTSATVEQLCAGGAQGLHAVPQGQMKAVLVAAAKDVDLGVLKVSLMESFRAEVSRLVDRASSPFNLQAGLTSGKAELMQGLMRDLMDSPNVESMLELVDAAAGHHRQLWQLHWGARSGGTTEVLLKDIRICIQRHAEPAQLPVP